MKNKYQTRFTVKAICAMVCFGLGMYGLTKHPEQPNVLWLVMMGYFLVGMAYNYKKIEKSEVTENDA